MTTKPQPIPKSAKTVVVASTMEHDVVLHVDEVQEVHVTGQYGSTTEKQFVPKHPYVTVWGKSRPRGEPPPGYTIPERIANYAITRGVDAAWWERWLDQHRETPMVENQLIMAFADEDSLRAWIAERRDVRSGLEPVNPDNDPRLPKPINSAVGRIEIAPRDAS